MEITRSFLIDSCNQFLDGRIDEKGIKEFAWNSVISDEGEWDDDIISETIFDWDNEEINYKINRHNMQLWKKRLETGVDELFEHNYWNAHIEKQKEICSVYHSKWNPINKRLLVGASVDLVSDPISGLRHPAENGTTGWFIWTGEYSKSEDFFKPICAEHLLQTRPEIIRFLGLDIGFRFLSDKSGNQDVWYDDTIKSI